MQDVVILSPINPDDNFNTSDVDSVKKAVSTKLKSVPYDIPNSGGKTGNIAVRFPSSTARDRGVEAISEGTLGYKYRDATKMLPKLTLQDVPSFVLMDVDKTNLSQSQIREAEKTAIINEICSKNQAVDELVKLGHTLQVVYMGNPSTRGTISVGLKVSPTIRLLLLDTQNGFVFVGDKRIIVKDRFFVKQCYHCQLFGHVSADCPQQQSRPTCLYCMGSHRSSLCTNKHNVSAHSCAKCSASKIQSDVAGHKTHNSASTECPVYKRECKRLVQVTDFTSKNVM